VQKLSVFIVYVVPPKIGVLACICIDVHMHSYVCSCCMCYLYQDLLE